MQVLPIKVTIDTTATITYLLISKAVFNMLPFKILAVLKS